MAPTSTQERPTLPQSLRRDSLWTFGLLGASALLWALGLPLALLVVVTGPAAIIFAISALVNSRGVEAVNGIRVWLWISIAMGGMILLGGLGLILMRGATEAFDACMDRAITETAKRECQAQYERDIDELMKRYSTYDPLTGR